MALLSSCLWRLLTPLNSCLWRLLTSASGACFLCFPGCWPSGALLRVCLRTGERKKPPTSSPTSSSSSSSALASLRSPCVVLSVYFSFSCSLFSWRSLVFLVAFSLLLAMVSFLVGSCWVFLGSRPVYFSDGLLYLFVGSCLVFLWSRLVLVGSCFFSNGRVEFC